MATMTAVRIHRFGGPEILEAGTVPLPQPQDDEVLVRVHAASVNPVDYKIRSGHYPRVTPEDLPKTLGRGLSGTVETCGTRAHTLRKGDPIVAFLAPDRGAYAEYVVVKAVDLAAKPASLDHQHAAAVLLAGLTAWQGLFDHWTTAHRATRPHPWRRRGRALHDPICQGKRCPCRDHGIREVPGVRALGANDVIDYKAQRFENVAHEIDFVFDLIASETQERSWEVSRAGGVLISTLAQPSQEKAQARNARGAHYLVQPNAAPLAEIGRLIDDGKVRVMIDTAFPLGDVQAANGRQEHSHVRGKIILTIPQHQ